VLLKAPCPVLVVPAQKKKARAEKKPTGLMAVVT
jgi:hypothetical protein